ncbi:hypothetical protein ACK8HX_06900 [Oryzobacter sp. R7]|uniref:hypothetical protein n=1 Tax=Oryzobacter faecalis TaxID=3388656 RepID=UPI00398D067B
MCRAATCRLCGKTTWAGCGQHVDQVMAGVARADRCPGHTDAERAAATGPTLLGRLLGRG